jgi:hypothetical protein
MARNFLDLPNYLWIFFNYKINCDIGGGTVAITTVAYSLLTSEERRHTLQIRVSIGVLGRRVPGPIVLQSILDGRLRMAVRHQSVQFVDIVVIQF